jgi:hypothetical protein
MNVKFLAQRLAPDKLLRNIPLVVNFKNCSKNLVPSRTLVAMATKRKNVKYLL